MDADLRAELAGEVDATFGETVAFHPKANGTDDPDRDASEIVAVLCTGERGDAIGGERRKTIRVGVNASGGSLRIDRTAYPDLVVRQDDRIRAIERAGQPWFDVLSVDDRSHLRLILELGDV